MKSFYEFKNQTETSSDLYMYGDIVSENTPDWWTGEVSETATDLKTFKEAVDGLGEGSTLNIYINSGGGSVFAASTMVSMLKRARERGAKIITHIDGLAASAASFFPMASDECHIYSNSMLMMHKPLSFMWGYYNSTELKKLEDELNAIEDGVLIPLYEGKSKDLSHQQIKNLVAAETWMNAQQMADTFNGFILHEEEKQAVACVSKCFDRYLNTPAAYLKPQSNPVPNASPDYSEFENKLKNISKKGD